MEEVKTSKAKKKLTLFVALVVVVTYRHNFCMQAQRTEYRAATVRAVIVNRPLKWCHRRFLEIVLLCE